MSEERIRQSLIRDCIILAILLGGLGFLVLATVQSLFPRMRGQQSIKPLERAFPPMPEGVVPSEGAERPVVTEHAASLWNPVSSSSQSKAVGAAYYRAYCHACHGPDGKGNMPAGMGYIPRPSDLSSPEIQARSDGELYQAMVEGKGHEPIMRETVPAERRWYIVHYMREL